MRFHGVPSQSTGRHDPGQTPGGTTPVSTPADVSVRCLEQTRSATARGSRFLDKDPHAGRGSETGVQFRPDGGNETGVEGGHRAGTVRDAESSGRARRLAGCRSARYCQPARGEPRERAAFYDGQARSRPTRRRWGDAPLGGRASRIECRVAGGRPVIPRVVRSVWPGGSHASHRGSPAA
jgi:hypothetical protein